MHRYNFHAPFHHDTVDGGFLILFRDIPEAITEAETIENGFIEATDCIEEAIAGRIDDGLDIPKPSQPRRSEHLISVPAHTAIKAALYLAMVEKEVNKSELARRLNVDVREVRRMLNPHHGTKLPAMEQALEALGKHIELHVT